MNTNTLTLRKLGFALCLLITLFCFAQAFKIEAKATLAQYLISGAWEESLQTQKPVKPWSSADTWPVLNLGFSNGKNYYVLEGQNGQSLAFGPAHLSESGLPGENTEIVISAHRDTHFTDLKNIVIGDTVTLQDNFSKEHAYRVVSARIVDTRIEKLVLDDTQESLRLITCFPFDAVLPNGPLRYELVAVPVDVHILSEFQNPDLHSAL